MVTQVNSRQQIALLEEQDFLLTPAIPEGISSGSFDEAGAAIPSGYEVAMQRRAGLSRYSLSEEDWQQRRTIIEACLDGPPIIDFVRVHNTSRFDDSVIWYRLDIPLGEVLDFTTLDSQVQDIYSLGFLQRVTYDVVDTEEGTGVIVHVRQDSRGADFFEYGIGINSSSFSGNFNLRLGFLKTDVGRYGAEFRALAQLGQDLGLLTEFYQPLGPGLNWFMQPSAAVERSDQNVFDEDGNILSQLTFDQWFGQLALGREIGVRASAAGGVRVGGGHVDVRIGDPLIPNWIAIGARLSWICITTPGTVAISREAEPSDTWKCCRPTDRWVRTRNSSSSNHSSAVRGHSADIP